MQKQILGNLSIKIAKENNLEEYANKNIVLYNNDRRHCINRHLKDFPNSKSFYYIMDNLKEIVNYPDNVFYVASKNTLEYYKYFADLNITIRVRIEPGKELKMKTMFISNPAIIKGRAEHKEYNKYVIGVE